MTKKNSHSIVAIHFTNQGTITSIYGRPLSQYQGWIENHSLLYVKNADSLKLVEEEKSFEGVMNAPIQFRGDHPQNLPKKVLTERHIVKKKPDSNDGGTRFLSP